MPSRDYQIVFRGRIVPGVDEQTARATLAKLFKTDVASIERLFDGRRQILKKGLAREQADQYRAALRKAGLMVSVVSEETQRQAQIMDSPAEPSEPAEVASPPPTQPAGRASFVIDDPLAADTGQKAVFAVDDSEPPPQSAPVTAGVTEEPPVQPESQAGTTAGAQAAPGSEDEQLAPVGVQLVAHTPHPAVTFDLADIELAEEGSIVDDTPPPPRLEVDTDDLSASDDFAALDDAQPPSPIKIDLAGLSVAEGDTPVDDSQPAPAPNIDVSELSLTDNEGALDAQPSAAAPSIDTSHLSLD